MEQPMTKQELRKYYKQLRKSMTAEQKLVADNVVLKSFKDSNTYKKADTILVYVSTEFEVDTREIIKNALSLNKNVYCPVCVSDTNIMRFFAIHSFDDLKEGSYGILEPNGMSDEYNRSFENAICVVPALAYDRRGYRIGYGKGYYDRFLSENSIRTVGLCYDNCLTDIIPCDEFDISVDMVITESEITVKGGVIDER